MKTQRVTPDWLAEEIARARTINYNRTEFNVLEPSCGDGAIVNFLVQRRYDNITAVELNKDKINIVKEKYPDVNCIHGDFMNIQFTEKFDLIRAMPPFKDNIDLVHIMKMYDLLKDGGEIFFASDEFIINLVGYYIRTTFTILSIFSG
jgi:16S rRNA A1518/A1519 N6-dimethyltransferase RsmA/KsgA/DIM1 with predicted DNA glycosylase/AP lyase activity